MINLELKTYKERKEFLERELKEEYFNNLLDVNYKSLVEHTSALCYLEKYTNYLLKGDDLNYWNKELEYPMHKLSNKELRNRLEKRECRFVQDENGRDIIPEDNGNVTKYKSKDIVITKALINEDSDMGAILRGYEPVRVLLGKELEKYKHGEGKASTLEYGLIRRQLSSIKSDMVHTIKCYKGLDYEQPPATKEKKVDCDSFDYGNWRVIKKIIGTGLVDLKNRTACNSELISILTLDLIRAVKGLGLNELDYKIIEMYNEGHNLEQISKDKEINLHHSNVSRRIDKICKLISNYLIGK